MTDQSEWPAYLRDDAPLVTCNGCGRKAAAPFSMPGDLCSMPQPNGTLCTGTFDTGDL